MMSMSRCVHRERGGSARGGFDFSRTDTTSCTERSNGDQENEQRFPLRGGSLSARALSRYFLDKGTAIYTRRVFWWRHCLSAGPRVTWPRLRLRSSG